MRKTPLKQKTGLRRTTKLRKAKPGVIAAQVHQRRVLVARSGSRCEFEKIVATAAYEFVDGRGQEHHDWARCGKSGGMTCHIISRPKCGQARDLWEVALYGCFECHKIYDDPTKSGVRVPLRDAQRSWDCVVAHSKLGLDGNGQPIGAKGLGERPRAGEGVYR